MSSFPDFADDCYEQKRETLMDLGLDPDDPDFSDLAPHGMSGDENDDEEVEDGDVIENYRDVGNGTQDGDPHDE